MTHTKQHCSTPDQLLTFLRGQLSVLEEAELQQHLNDCVACRERLESTAADASVWNEAKEFFGNGALHAVTRGISEDHDDSNQGQYRIRQVLDSLGPTDDPESLGRIGGYEVTGVVGAGGMGVVLKAHDRSLDRIVAIKVMAPHLASSGSARKRFAREAKAAAAVLHPNVIAIHSVASEDANPYLVMPFVRGASLQKRIDSQGPLPLKDALRIGAQIAAGLAAAHEQGLVHRDIKPANILLEEGVERVTITDFGLARAVDDASMTCSGVIAGTPQYMSPEQARGEPIDARSDLFSLGGVLYAMCTGRSPFRAETTYGVLHRIANDKPTPVCEVNSDVPVWLGHVIERLMAKRPEDRFESAAQVAELLEGCLAHVQQPAAIVLPVGVQALAAQTQRPTVEAPTQNRLKSIPLRVPQPAKYIAVAAGVFALFFAGILIVLESGKGTLTIESEMDNVPIRIVQGKDVVEELNVSKSGNSVRIAAGTYDVEIQGEYDGLSLDKGSVSLSRGGKDVVRIIRASGMASQASGVAKNQPVSFRAPFQGRIRWGDDIHENAFVEKGHVIAGLTEFDPELLDRLEKQLSTLKEKADAAQTFVRVSEENRKDYSANVNACEALLRAYEQVKRQIATAGIAKIASAKSKIESLKAEVAERIALMEQAQKELAVQEELFEQAKISELMFQEAQQKVTVAAAKCAQSEAETKAAEYDLITQQNELQAKNDKAQIDVEYANSALSKAKVEVVKVESDLAKAKFDLNVIQKEVADLEIKLTKQDRLLVHAPDSGFVTKLCQNELVAQGDIICMFCPASDASQTGQPVDMSGSVIGRSPVSQDRSSKSTPEFPPVKIVVHDEEGKPREGVKVNLIQLAKDQGGQVLEINETSNANGLAVNRNLPYGHYTLSAKTSDGWYLQHGSRLNVEFEKGLDVVLVAPTASKMAKLVISSDLGPPSAAINELRFGELQEGNGPSYSASYTPEPVEKPIDGEAVAKKEGASPKRVALNGEGYESFPSIVNGIEYVGAEIDIELKRNIPQSSLSLDHIHTTWEWYPTENNKLKRRYLVANSEARSLTEPNDLRLMTREGSELFRLPSPNYRVGASLLELGEPTALPLELAIPAGDVKVYIGRFYGKPNAAALAALNWRQQEKKSELWLEAHIPRESAWIERLMSTTGWVYSTPGEGSYILSGHLLRQEASLTAGATLKVSLTSKHSAQKTPLAFEARTLDDITSIYNEQTRQLRTELFTPPIPDLTTAQMRQAMLDAAEQYRKHGRVEVSSALETSAETNRLANRLTFMGVTGAMSDGFRQITPQFHFEVASNSLLLVVLGKAELRYSRNGWSSKTWGDIHPPITGKWELVSVEQRGETLTQTAYDQWRKSHENWIELTIEATSLTMAGDNAAKLDFSVDYDAGPLPQYTIRQDGNTKYSGVLMGNGFIDDNELIVAVDLEGSSTPKTFHTKDGKTTKLTYRRMPAKPQTDQIIDAGDL